MRNLGRLGQVRVDHGMSSVRPEATRTQELFRSRAATESGAQTGVEGPTLAILLGMRADGYAGLGQELKRVGMEAGALERVARYVNAPRVKPGSQKKRLDNQSVEHFEMEVRVFIVLRWLGKADGAIRRSGRRHHAYDLGQSTLYDTVMFYARPNHQSHFHLARRRETDCSNYVADHTHCRLQEVGDYGSVD
jgi:hypothetical protein